MPRRTTTAATILLVLLTVLPAAGCGKSAKPKDVAALLLWGGRETAIANGHSVRVTQSAFSLGIRLEPGGSAAEVAPFVKASIAPTWTDGTSADGAQLAILTWGPDAQGQAIAVEIGKGAPLGDGFTAGSAFAVTIERRPEPHLITFSLRDHPTARYINFIPAGRHVFDIEFDTDMDRASVEKVVTGSLSLTEPEIMPEFAWTSNRALTVKVDFLPPFLSADYIVSLDGALDNEGIPLIIESPPSFTVCWPSQVLAVQLPPGEAETPLIVVDPGRTVSDVSPDGTTAVALEPPNDWDPDGMMGVVIQHPWRYRSNENARDLSPALGEVVDVQITGDTLWSEVDGDQVLLGASLDLSVTRRVEWNTHWLLGHAVSGDGRVVAWFTPASTSVEGRSRVVNLNVYRADTAEVTVFRGIVSELLPYGTDVAEPLAMALDHTGAKLAYTNWFDGDDADLTMIDVSSGRVASTMNLGTWGAGCTLSANGTRAAGVGWATDLSTGTVTHYAEFDSSAPVLSPDGRFLACAVAMGGAVNDSGPTLIKLVEIDTGRKCELGEGYPVSFSDDGARLFIVRKAK